MGRNFRSLNLCEGGNETFSFSFFVVLPKERVRSFFIFCFLFLFFQETKKKRMVLKTPSSSSSSFFVFFFFLFLSSVSLSSISNSSSFSFDQWLEGLISTETKTEREREIERERRGADPMSVRAWHLGPEIARDFSSDFDYVTHIDVSSAWRSLVRGFSVLFVCFFLFSSLSLLHCLFFF